MSPRIISLLFASATFAGCATAPKQKQEEIKRAIPIVVRAKAIESQKKETFELISLTVENSSDKWVRIGGSEVSTQESLVPDLSVVVGSDLKNWAEAVQLRQESEQGNDRLKQIALLAVGATIATGGADSARAAGAVLLTGAYGWAASDVLNQSQLLSRTNGVPDSHVYQPFAVPGKMALRRWLLINKPVGHSVDKFSLTLETVEGVKETYVITL